MVRLPKQQIYPPDIPDKLEIIPIHASDRGTFKRCRRRWDWSSPMRDNLVPRADAGAVVMPLWFGSGIHWALRHYYDPILSRDPVEVFQMWWEVQWNGGIITEDWLDQVYDRKPKLIPGQVHDRIHGPAPYEYRDQYEPDTWKVQGLKDLIPDPDIGPFEEHRELGINMMKYYKDYAAEFDNFSVIMAEHTFSVPVVRMIPTAYATPDKVRLIGMEDKPLTAVDPRDGVEKEVHIRGTQDAIIQDNESGRFGILEHKSAIRIDEDYFRKLDKDEQCTTYMYAAEREAAMHDLEYDKIDFVIYNAIRKAFPRPPTEVRGGVFSIDRAKESTTPEMLQEFIDDRGIQIIVDTDEKLQNYVEYVNSIGHEQFVKRDMVRRNRAEIRSCGSRIYMEVMDMLDDPRIYPNPTGDYMCLNCPFRAPCIAVDDGSDAQMMLDDLFEKNWSR